MKTTYQDIQEFADTLEKVRELFPGDDLEPIEDWEDLWVYTTGIRKVRIRKYRAIKDIFGWYRQTWVLGPFGWKLKEIGDYQEDRDSCLLDGEHCIYEYID